MKWVLRVLSALVLFVGAAFLFGPYEPVDLAVSYDDTVLQEDPGAYLARREAVFDDVVPGAEKRIVWANNPGARTALSVVYMHGFSANAEEIRPVPDQVAKALGANLYFARLAGHGRSADAMAGPTASDWMIDMAEAMAVGRAIGEEVIVIATSTGGTIAALGALDPEISKSLKGITFISPNFRIKNSASSLLTFPAARQWVPLIVGETRGFEPLNERQAQHWTEEYPTAALFAMAAIVKASRGADYSDVGVPALFVYALQDQVVDAKETESITARWGAPTQTHLVEPGEGIEPSAHVLAGDIVSPAGTAPTVEKILDWVGGL